MADVSVITPVFNTENYLHQCIQSVLGEKSLNIELVLVDDGSTDNSARILQHYAQGDGRVRVITKENGGQGVARNVGIEAAVGKYLYFLDSDDYLDPDCLKILHETSEQNHLDICAPASPGYYYEKPLEFVACIPTRMQFVLGDLVNDNQIRQPDVASGQDGVFGHLLLTRCRRLGVARRAVCHYRPNRPGSTFARYSQRPDVVIELIRKHFSYITQYYDAHDLWPTQSARLLSFIVDETMKNRLAFHFDALDSADRIMLFEYLSGIARRAYQFLPQRFRGTLHPAVAALIFRASTDSIDAFRTHYLEKGLEQPIPENFNLYNEKKQVYVCKPHWRPTARNSDYIKVLDRKTNGADDRIRLVESKLDFAINTLINTQADHRQLDGLVSATTRTSKSSIVVSMTTLASRLATVHLPIESAMAQSLQPQKVVLWIDEKIDFDLNEYPRLALSVEKGLEICRIVDVGPHTKLVYAAQRFPESSIVTMDDDMIYPSTTLAVLDQFSKVFPKMVVANWARELTLDKGGTVRGVRAGRLLTPTSLEKQIEQEVEFAARPSYRAFAYGTSGVLYPPGSLHPTTFDFDLMRELCPKEDDIWFKAMTLLTSTPVVPTNLGINPRHYSVLGSQSVALRHDNHASGGNATQMKNVFKYFDLYSKMSEQAEEVLLRKLDHPWC